LVAAGSFLDNWKWRLLPIVSRSWRIKSGLIFYLWLFDWCRILHHKFLLLCDTVLDIVAETFVVYQDAVGLGSMVHIIWLQIVKLHVFYFLELFLLDWRYEFKVLLRIQKMVLCKNKFYYVIKFRLRDIAVTVFIYLPNDRHHFWKLGGIYNEEGNKLWRVHMF